MSESTPERDWWAESQARIAAADEAAEQSQLAFLTGNGPAYMQATADEIRQRWEEEYKGPTDGVYGGPDDSGDVAAGIHSPRGAEPDSSGSSRSRSADDEHIDAKQSKPD